MQITGLQTRSVATQTGSVFFDFTASASESTGVHSFGLSGGAVFGFTLSGGKVYDPNGNFSYYYLPNEQVRISGVVSPTSFNYTANGTLIALGQPTSSQVYSGGISKLYASSSASFELTSFLQGESSDYSIQETGLYSYINPLVSGKIINNVSGRPFRIFDATLNGASSYAITSFTTGDITNTGYIVFSGDGFGLQDEIVPVSLATNFGQVDYEFTISGDNSATPDVYLNLSPDSTVVLNNSPLYINAVAANYPTGSRIGVSLEYVSGITGNIYFYSGATGGAESLMSGNITGCGALSYQVTGLVSGLDPKTAIWETGIGTGQFSSATYCATGNVSGDYSVRLGGLGQGTLQFDYSASGDSSGYYYGRVPVSGTWLNAVAYNYAGTGEFPVVLSVTVPTGTGKVFVYPTGCLDILETVTSGDYYAANLSVPKVYSGPIVYNYSTVGVGFATGRTFSGIVTSAFVPEFEQGSYYFTKYYSGLVSGNSIVSTGIFDISTCPSAASVSGIITGNFSASYPLLCSDTRSFPTIPISGYPSAVYNSDGTLAEPNTVYTFSPSGGFENYVESLDARLSGTNTKTKISRMGATASGTGTFYNPVADCALLPRVNSSSDILDHIWKEKIAGVTTQTAFDSLDNGIGIVNTKLYITGTGDFGEYPSGAQDSGVMEFFISGSGLKSVALKGLNKGETDRILNLTLYKNGILTDSWENLYVQPDLYAKYGEATYNTAPQDTMVISELGSGKYSLVVTAKHVALPQLSFTQAEFSGCESSNAISVMVQAQGVFRDRCFAKITNYDEVTAHSGVHYDPIYLDYSNPDIASSGRTNIQAHAPRGGTYYGVFFEASAPDAYGRWQEETKYFEFTIPIYDNAVYGDDAYFNIYLEELSGCSYGATSTTSIRIVDNDNRQFEIGGTGMMPDISALDCSLVPDVEPPEPPVCVIDPSLCDPCVADPTLCVDPDPPCDCGDVFVACLPPANTRVVTGDCNGTFVSGTIGIPGATAGSVTAAGCGPTTGYMLVGQIPAFGTYFVPTFSGNCLDYEVLAYRANCGRLVSEIPCTGNTGECPQAIQWSGCTETNGTMICSGNSPVILFQRDPCENFADGEFHGKITACALDIFLKVTSNNDCSTSSSPGCHSWAFTGASVYPRGNPIDILCGAYGQ